MRLGLRVWPGVMGNFFTWSSSTANLTVWALGGRWGWGVGVKVTIYAPPFRPPFFRFLENLHSFDPYILANMRKMSYFDPYFSSKLGKMYSFFFYPCSVSSWRAVRSIPIRNLTEYPPTQPPTSTCTRYTGHQVPCILSEQVLILTKVDVWVKKKDLKLTFPLNIWKVGGLKSIFFLRHLEKGGLKSIFFPVPWKRGFNHGAYTLGYTHHLTWA